MDQPYKAISDLFRGNKITFGGRIDWLPVKPPNVSTPVTFNDFTLLFHDHSEPAPDRITDSENGKSFPFNVKRFFFERRPEGAEAVFTAFPGQPYLLETPGHYWPIYDVSFPGISKSLVIETQNRSPTDRGQIHRDPPPQALGKN